MRRWKRTRQDFAEFTKGQDVILDELANAVSGEMLLDLLTWLADFKSAKQTSERFLAGKLERERVWISKR